MKACWGARSTMLAQVGDEALSGEDARLWEAIDALVYAHQHVSIANQSGDVIPLLDDTGDMP